MRNLITKIISENMKLYSLSFCLVSSINIHNPALFKCTME